jgi:hypothetical protein
VCRFTLLAENTTVGTRFYTYRARDADEDAVIRYRLLHDQVIGEDEMKRPVKDKSYLMVNRENNAIEYYINSAWWCGG